MVKRSSTNPYCGTQVSSARAYKNRESHNKNRRLRIWGFSSWSGLWKKAYSSSRRLRRFHFNGLGFLLLVQRQHSPDRRPQIGWQLRTFTARIGSQTRVALFSLLPCRSAHHVSGSAVFAGRSAAAGPRLPPLAPFRKWVFQFDASRRRWVGWFYRVLSAIERKECDELFIGCGVYSVGRPLILKTMTTTSNFVNN